MKISKNGNLTKTYQGKYVADEETLKSIEKHLNATAGNPHKVTLEEIGAYSAKKIENKSLVDFAVAVETFGKITDEDNESIPKFKMTESEGLAFEDNDDGKTCSVSGIGMCSDTEVVIPMFSPSGKLVSTLKLGAFEGNENITALFIPKSVCRIWSYSMNCPNLKILALSNPDVIVSARKITAQLDKVYFNGSYDAFIRSGLHETIMSENTKLFCGFFDVDLLLSKADADKVYTKEEVDSKIDVISSEVGNRYTKEEVDNKLEEIGGSVDAYTKAEIDEKLKNPSYEEQVKLKGITTAVPGWDDAVVEINDNSVSSDWCTFDIDIHGEVRFTCECTESRVGINIDGKFITDIGVDSESGATKYTFDGVIENGMSINCSMATAVFSEFTKKVYVKDAIGDINGKIGDIDSALDELHGYAASLIGGGA